MKLVTLILVVLVMSCSSTPPPQQQQYINPAAVNIRAVSHPRLVDGLVFIHGETISAGTDDPNVIGKRLAEELALKGYHSLVIYPELVMDRGISQPQPMNNPGGAAGGFVSLMNSQMATQGYISQQARRYVWQISIYQAR